MSQFRFNDAMSDGGESSIGAGSIISESFVKYSQNRSSFTGPQRSGYLYKMIDAKTFKRRYFETNGFYLTYFKSKKKTKLLAALNMRRVTKIELVADLPEEISPTESGCYFQILVSGNSYVLRGASPTDTMRWIRVLNDLKDGVETDSVHGDDDTLWEEGALLQPAGKGKGKKKVESGNWDGYFTFCCFA